MNWMKTLLHVSSFNSGDYIKQFSQVFQDGPEWSDDPLCWSSIFYVYPIILSTTYLQSRFWQNREKSNRVKMAASKYQNTMVKMVGWNGSVLSVPFLYLPYHECVILAITLVLFVKCLCASQDSFNCRWTNPIQRHPIQMSIYWLSWWLFCFSIWEENLRKYFWSVHFVSCAHSEPGTRAGRMGVIPVTRPLLGWEGRR